MARISFAAHPFLLGFEQIDRILEKTIKSSNDGFPPYNIELSDDNHYKITLAVAGFSEDELSITLEERQLIISGKQVEKTNHIYRVNVDWYKVQRNFRAFIRAGGKAIWKFLVFDHNKHQLDDVHERSRKEGFWRFRSEASMRISDDKTVKNFATKEHTKLKEIQNKIQDDISCKALDINRLYINAESRIWPCCYTCLLYTSPSPRDLSTSRMPSSA